MELLSAIAVAALATIAALLAAGLLRARRHDIAFEQMLVSEVHALRTQAGAVAAEIARRHKAGEILDHRFFAIWRLSEPLIYPNLGSGLAVLDPEAMERVGTFHALLSDARTRLAEARSSLSFEPSPYRILCCLVRACNHVQPWLNARTSPDDPLSFITTDLSEANLVLGQLESAATEPIMVAYSWVDAVFQDPV